MARWHPLCGSLMRPVLVVVAGAVGGAVAGVGRGGRSGEEFAGVGVMPGVGLPGLCCWCLVVCC